MTYIVIHHLGIYVIMAVSTAIQKVKARMHQTKYEKAEKKFRDINKLHREQEVKEKELIMVAQAEVERKNDVLRSMSSLNDI